MLISDKCPYTIQKIVKYISMVANQKHVYPNLQLFRKRKKLIYSAMPRYIVLKLINYGNHIL